ncbi:hypothetical protein HELRODRAFT_81460 [Helobdella robusta]|uniref:Serine/threonine-protein phosphatase 4 regulatory subunit 3-like central domain-containing protein n=1 Tax=Helobdella robusta TaxID=6412 RepID=T1G4E4_HELRO|nr:hypothetical protein HELRODRAFT_81460 [Helobdella robusta]ESO01568.1 hypothetical protein HELRODRAFT_81460 [Helobdella robusta]
MFWKSIYLPSKITALLEKEDVTLEELLKEDDIIDECKSCNTQLIDIIVKEENLKKIVDMMVSRPDDELSEKEKYRNAHVACEILTSDLTRITEALSENEACLEKIYSFFRQEPPLNPLQSSFFSKTMGLLITHESRKTLSFLKSKDDFVDLLMRNLNISAISDLLLRLITCIETIEVRNECFQWLSEQKIVERLLALVDASQSNEVCANQ